MKFIYIRTKSKQYKMTSYVNKTLHLDYNCTLVEKSMIDDLKKLTFETTYKIII